MPLAHSKCSINTSFPSKPNGQDQGRFLPRFHLLSLRVECERTSMEIPHLPSSPLPLIRVTPLILDFYLCGGGVHSVWNSRGLGQERGFCRAPRGWGPGGR